MAKNEHRKNLAARTSRRQARRDFTLLTLGIHVDSPRCYGVLLQNDTPIEVYQGRGPTPAEQIRHIITDAKNPSRIRIAYTNTANQHHRFLATPNITNYTTLVANAAPPSPYPATYAAIYNTQQQQHATTPGLLIATPTETNDALQSEVANTSAQYVDPVITYSQLDGLSLNIGNSAPTLTLTKNSQPQQHTLLPVPGIDTLTQELGTTSTGEPRLTRILKTRPDQQSYVDPQATQATITYLQDITQHIAETLRYWAQQGHLIPRQIFVHGPGAIARRLTHALKTITLEQITDPAFTALAQLDPDERHQYITAYLAAKTYNTTQPHTQFPTTKALHSQTEKTTTLTRKKRHRNLQIVTALAAATLITPLAGAGLDYFTAHTRATTAAENYAATLHLPTEAVLKNAPLTPPPAATLQTFEKLNTGQVDTITQTAAHYLQLVLTTDTPDAALNELKTLATIHHTRYDPTKQQLTAVLEIEQK